MSESLNDLISSMFSVNMMLMATEAAKHLCQNVFNTDLHSLFNHFAKIYKINQTIRDLSTHQAYALHKLEFRFIDIDSLKNRPNGAQVKKMLFESVSSMSCSAHLESLSCDTPWYEEWRNTFFKTFELAEHEFIGAHFGCFFIITVAELNHFKDILPSLLAQVKQVSSIRWIQPDFVRFYIVISDSHSAQSNQNADSTQLFSKLDAMYSSSYWLQINSNHNDNNSENVFSENNKMNDGVDHQASDNSIIDDAGDPLNASMSKFVMSDKQRHSSSDQSTNTSSPLPPSINESDRIHSQPNIPEGLSSTIEDMLREFITKALIPWSEKQIKLLSESISQRKGLRRSIFSATKSLLNNMSSSTVGLKSSPMTQSVIYSTEAPEMQQRKLGDLSMCLTMYELAYNSYYSAKKEFQSEGAWLYYAAASEASAMASFFMSKFQRHYFDQAINCYLDTCKSLNYATRATILATEAIRNSWPNEAANLFIRMTGDDSDLRSALFLEQASKCFIAAGSRMRKAAFHYVLAGHRFNRCGLKHFALACYRRFNSQYWGCAADHVNLTIARLYLSIANTSLTTNSRFAADYKNRGFEIMRVNANKQVFFQEFLREIKKDLEDLTANCTPTCFYLEIPFIKSVSIEPSNLEAYQLQDQNIVCFVNEEIVLKLILVSPFLLDLHSLRFYNNNPANTVCTSISSSLNAYEESHVYLPVIPLIECDFEIIGIEYKVDDKVTIRCEMSERIRKALKFRSIKTLPLIEIDISFPSNTNTAGPLRAFAGEVVDFNITLKCRNDCGWSPSTMTMSTNAHIITDFPAENTEHQLEVYFDRRNSFKMQIPQQSRPHHVFFKLQYTDTSDNKSRILIKNMHFIVDECLSVENSIENVVTLRNLLDNESITLWPQASQSIVIPAKLASHTLVDEPLIPWNIGSRHGIYSLDKIIYNNN